MNYGLSKYIPNYFTIKKFNENLYKMVIHKYPIKNPLWEDSNREIVRDVNNHKLDNNLSRAKSKVFEYSMCNDFEYFVTLTLDPNKNNSYDLSLYIKKLGQFIRDYRKKTGLDTQYILIPEQHKSGAWHMHGLLKGISENDLFKNKNGYLDWKPYSNKFGYISIQKIRSKEGVAKYITKYITKNFDLSTDMNNSPIGKNKKLYYASRGLKQAELILDGSIGSDVLERIKGDIWQNDYVRVLEFDKITFSIFKTSLKNY